MDLIDAALERIDEGSYGHCVQCDGVIPKARLNAIPYTPVCIKCAEPQEKPQLIGTSKPAVFARECA